MSNPTIMDEMSDIIYEKEKLLDMLAEYTGKTKEQIYDEIYKEEKELNIEEVKL